MDTGPMHLLPNSCLKDSHYNGIASPVLVVIEFQGNHLGSAWPATRFGIAAGYNRANGFELEICYVYCREFILERVNFSPSIVGVSSSNIEASHPLVHLPGELFLQFASALRIEINRGFSALSSELNSSNCPWFFLSVVGSGRMVHGTSLFSTGFGAGLVPAECLPYKEEVPALTSSSTRCFTSTAASKTGASSLGITVCSCSFIIQIDVAMFRFMSVTCYVAVCRFINLMPGVMSMLTIGFQVNFDSGSGLL
ncbi:hypothetical protein KIW84_013709 [Lathyrus oleraceus]|uniref:Uncharacterized protein n=1 Tax=Pisum sativum TaxID=3888 RepID=A0A9D5GY52_PEA|nr:hypothetical protein KIW84_013709 [Pisum sativum]